MLKKKVGIDFIKKHSEGKIGNPKSYYYKKLYFYPHYGMIENVKNIL